MGWGSSLSRGGNGCFVYWCKGLDFGYLYLLFFISLLLIVFYIFLWFYVHSFVLHFILSLSSIVLSNVLNVSRIWAQWLTAVLFSLALTILKHAAYSIMLKLSIWTSFCAHWEYSLTKTSETKIQWPKIFAWSQLNRQKQQASVAQGIRPMTVKRRAGVQAWVGAEIDA